MTYKRVTSEERRLIYAWRKEGCGKRAIARRLGRSASTICREIARNTGKHGYRYKQAEEKARERALRPGPRRFTDGMKAEIEAKLEEGWTPEIISQRACYEGRPFVCRETIYQYIYADAKEGGMLWHALPRAKRKRRRRCPRTDGRRRGKIPNQRRIDERPAEAESRSSAGHWEGDLINGANGTGHLVTLVDRCTRDTRTGRTNTKEAGEVSQMVCELLADLPPELKQTVTFDNGKEFAYHEKIAKEIGIEVFFARPYHSWERGTNENVNGLIRRLYPKKSSFADIGEDELKRIDRYLNDRPRKCLGWMTPREKMAEFLVHAP